MDKVLVIGRDTVPQEINLGEGERLPLTLLVLPGISCDVSLTVNLDAPGAELDLAGLFLCKASDNVRIKITVRHNSRECHSREVFRGIVGDSARAEFDGLIYVARDAQKTKASQEIRSILLNKEAVALARPQLEIYADDVECSHGATSGFLDSQECFYMQSRGIPEAEARRLQMISFLSPVAGRLPDELKDEVYETLA